uniref:Uncharacterized protein n=1 Tax=Anguilla anguilla TaxID=7936 RepID=A0A0E9T717_ANGAN
MCFIMLCNMLVLCNCFIMLLFVILSWNCTLKCCLFSTQ